jgi:hypothetical protein
MWHWLGIHRAAPPQPPASSTARDPDLTRVRHEQHNLINKVASDALRESLRRRWTDTQAETWRRHAHD